MNERDIQDFLFPWLEKKKHTLITPNVQLFGSNEADLISVTKAGMTNEYEIKCSVNDFKKDFRTKKIKHVFLGEAEAFQNLTPNYFYFVFPASVWMKIDINKVPIYAGILTINTNGEVKTTRRAKRLHSMPISKRNTEYLERGLMYRYWRIRASQAA